MGLRVFFSILWAFMCLSVGFLRVSFLIESHSIKILRNPIPNKLEVKQVLLAFCLRVGRLMHHYPDEIEITYLRMKILLLLTIIRNQSGEET